MAQVGKRADAFLNDQRALIADRSAVTCTSRKSKIHLDITEKWLGVFLRLATAVVGVAIARLRERHGVGCRHLQQPGDRLLTPCQPELAARGLSGSVVAAKLSDKIAVMQSETGSVRPARSYSNFFC
jgi:hypothetical protein